MSASAGRAVPLFKGDYNSATTYTFYDWVYYQGGTYACKVQSSTGHAPSDTNYWQILCGGAVSDPAELGLATVFARPQLRLLLRKLQSLVLFLRLTA